MKSGQNPAKSGHAHFVTGCRSQECGKLLILQGHL